MNGADTPAMRSSPAPEPSSSPLQALRARLDQLEFSVANHAASIQELWKRKKNAYTVDNDKMTERRCGVPTKQGLCRGWRVKGQRACIRHMGLSTAHAHARSQPAQQERLGSIAMDLLM